VTLDVFVVGGGMDGLVGLGMHLVDVAFDVLVLVWLEVYVFLLHSLPPFELPELTL
jgi:hypothetical protein